ncbi:MAG: hypothetical protein OXG09_04260 [Chloroflexi bacterium]|nr:hypothetical protein [Chloroflexota bacterium]
MLFDAISSQYRHGDWLLDESAIAIDEQHTGSGIESYQGERLQPILALTLYGIARNIPALGLVHTTWTFNILVTLAIVAAFFAYARLLGHSHRVCTFAALLLGTATILFPYTKTFFREPLVALLLLATAYCLERMRATSRNSRFAWLMAGLGCFLLALQTKESAALALPAMAALLFFDRPNKNHHAVKQTKVTSTLDFVLMLLIAFILIACLVDLRLLLQNLDHALIVINLPIPSLDWDFFQTAMASQILSPGGSFWGTSPVIALAIPGALLTWRSGSRRHIWLAVLLLAAYSIGHAARGPHWFGGLSWPPRFLLPIIPFFMLLALPVWEKLGKTSHRILKTGIFAWLAYSIAWQIAAVITRWEEIPLPAMAHGLQEWWGSLYLPQYLRPSLILTHLDQISWDFAWYRSQDFALPLVWLAFMALCGAMLFQLIVKRRNIPRGIIFSLPVSVVILSLVTLFRVAEDPVYRGHTEALEPMLTEMDEVVGRGDIVFVTQEYRDFILNHAKVNQPRFVVLNHQPGEIYDPEVAPIVASQVAAVNLSRHTVHRLSLMFQRHETFYFLSDAGPFLPWRPRVLERFFTENAYPIQEISTAPDVRLIEYQLAPLPEIFQEEEGGSRVNFGDELLFSGILLPNGLTYPPGAVIPMAARWSASREMTTDHTITWKLTRGGQTFASSMDWQPKAGLQPTSTWKVDEPIWDHRSIRLGRDMPDGEYQLWLQVYYFEEETIRLLPVLTGLKMDDHTAVLPITIRVQADAQ